MEKFVWSHSLKYIKHSFIHFKILNHLFFIKDLGKVGIRSTDPRLKNMVDMLKNLSTLPSFENLRLDQNTFKTVLSESIVFITRAFQNRMIIPAFETFCDNIRVLYEKVWLN